MFVHHLIVAVTLAQGYGPDPPDLPADAKCAWRTLAFSYAMKLRPDARNELRAALELDTLCPPPTASPISEQPPPTKVTTHLARKTVVHVDGESGDDSRDGSELLPLRTIAAGVLRCRSIGPASCAVAVRSGVYYSSRLHIDARDSGLVITSVGGRAWLSGGVPLPGIEWHREGSSRVWSADLSASGLAEIASLRVDGERRSPARWPNANPETQFWPTGYLTSKERFVSQGGDWLDPAVSPIPNPAVEVNVSSPNRKWDAQFSTYRGGINGTCAIYSPPFSYWCQSPPFSDGCGGCFTWNIPSGLNAAPLANRSTYRAAGKRSQLFAWRKAHWANWVFDVESIDQGGGGVVKFARGGWQGARGGPGSDWFVSNVFEELDDPLEFFYDESAKRLYCVSDAADGSTAPSGEAWVAIPASNHTLMHVDGTQAQPVRDLVIDGIGFRDAAWTMMQPHGVPGGGDWALERFASLFVEGTEHLTLTNLSFVRVDGNAIMLSKYQRNATLVGSSFKYLGGSAIALWGFTDELTDGGVHGVDGTTGEYPRYTTIERNLFREIGIWEKQSSAIFQGKAAQSTVRHNVIFNLGRAGINFNDGFGGGDLVYENVLFNTCRESSDHGPINSWDRQPFLTTVRDGMPSTQMAWRDVTRNLVVANYGGVKEVDTDDGSLFWRVHGNVMWFGWGMKFKCGAIESFDNLKLYIDLGGKFDAGCLLGNGAQAALTDTSLTAEDGVTYPNRWYNDTMLHLGTTAFAYRQCWGRSGSHDWDREAVKNNTIYVASDAVDALISGTASVCHHGDVPKDGYTLEAFQALGEEPNTKRIVGFPPVPILLEWSRAILGSFEAY